MRKDKRGISPLIATVLIIGFTIALAVVIMTWGTDFVKSIMGNTADTADKQMKCVSLDFDVTSVACGRSVGVNITIDNLRSREAIKYFNIRMQTASGDVGTVSTKTLDDTANYVYTGVEASGLVTLKNLVPSSFSGKVITKIDVIPVMVSDDGTEVICSEGAKTKTDLVGCVLP